MWPLLTNIAVTAAASGGSVLGSGLKLEVVPSAPTPHDKVTPAAVARYAAILNSTALAAVDADGGADVGAVPAAVTLITIEVQEGARSAPLALGLETRYNYTLALRDGGSSIALVAASPFAVAYGLETIAQLYSPNQTARFAGFRIRDAPRYPYRAVMIDAGRRFVPLSTLYEMIDGMAYSKLNVLNFHASEYGFFRIEIKAFPELTAGLSRGQYYSQDDIAALVQYAYLRGVRVVPQIDIPGHSSGLIPLKKHGVRFCTDAATPYCSTSHCQTQLYDDPGGATVQVVKQIYTELFALFPDVVFDIGGDETHVAGNCTMANIKSFELKILAHLAANHKRPMGWQQVYSVTGAAQAAAAAAAAAPLAHASTVIRVYNIPAGQANKHPTNPAPLLANVTAAKFDAVVADSVHYYMNSCCPATHGHRLCNPGDVSPHSGQPCYYTDIASFGNSSLTPGQRARVLGGSASMWTDAYCASNECGAWEGRCETMNAPLACSGNCSRATAAVACRRSLSADARAADDVIPSEGPTPEAGWMAPKLHDAAFHDSVLASVFPAASISAGAFYNYQPMRLAELTARWRRFNAGVLFARGVRSCPNGCSCAEDNYCGQL